LERGKGKKGVGSIPKTRIRNTVLKEKVIRGLGAERKKQEKGKGGEKKWDQAWGNF